MQYNVLTWTMVVAYLLFVFGSQQVQPLASAACGASSVVAKRAKPVDERRALPGPRRG